LSPRDFAPTVRRQVLRSALDSFSASASNARGESFYVKEIFRS